MNNKNTNEKTYRIYENPTRSNEPTTSRFKLDSLPNPRRRSVSTFEDTTGKYTPKKSTPNKGKGTPKKGRSQTTGRKERIDPDIRADRKCRVNLLDELHDAKDAGDLEHSMNVNDAEFEVLEFYGDSVLKETISKFILETRRFMDPHLMTQLRIMCIKNNTLAIVFDVLSIETLIPLEFQPMVHISAKGKIVEAIIGELIETDNAELAKKLIAFIAYIGEEEYFVKVNSTMSHRREPLRQSGYERSEPEESEPVTIGTTTKKTKTDTQSQSELTDTMLFFSPAGLNIIKKSPPPRRTPKKPTPASVNRSESLSLPQRQPTSSRRVQDFSYFA